MSQLKTVGTQKVSPFPPAAGHPPTTPFQKIMNAIKPLSGGLRGQPFAQHCSCPTVLRCSVGLTMAAFLGTIFVWEKWLPQSPRDKPCAQSARRQRPCCRPLRVEFLLHSKNASYTGRSGRASLRSRRSAAREFFELQKQTCQKLWPLRALGFEARLLLPSSSSKKIKRLVQSAFGGQSDFRPQKKSP